MSISISLQKSLLAFVNTVLFLFLFSSIIFAIFYLISDRQDLIDWYLGLGNIYQQADWPEYFFTPKTKSAGNIIVVMALLVGLPAAVYILRSLFILRFRKYQPFQFHISKQDMLACGVVTIFLFIMWLMGIKTVAPAYDEVFSVVFSAEAHPFHAISYYMLPNNHLLFNGINNLIFGFVDDKVFSGRIISLFAFAAAGIWQYFWLRDITKSRFVAGGIVLLAGSLLPILGFSGQGRGYMLLVLACWVSFISVYYYLRQHNKIWLYALAVFCFIGYTTLPSFLYFHVALFIFVIFTQFRERQFDLNFFYTQIWSGAFIFLFYVPALAFSGIDAFSDNRYVKPLAMSFYEFGVFFIPQLVHHTNYAISNVFQMESYLGPVIFLLPVLMLFFRREKAFRQIAFFYVILIAATILIIVKMKAAPYYRTSVFQLQFGVVCFALFTFSILKMGFNRKRAWVNGSFAVLLLIMSFFYVHRNRPMISYFLYYYDINSTYDSLTEVYDDIPKSASIAVSDEAYYLHYLGKRNGYKVRKEMNGSESYLMKIHHEVLRDINFDRYERITEWQGYEIYRRKPE